MHKLAILALSTSIFLPFANLPAQRPADAPETKPAGTPPDTVFIGELTWAEVRDFVEGIDPEHELTCDGHRPKHVCQ